MTGPTGPGSAVTVDSQPSSSSTNPLQNKALFPAPVETDFSWISVMNGAVTGLPPGTSGWYSPDDSQVNLYTDHSVTTPFGVNRVCHVPCGTLADGATPVDELTVLFGYPGLPDSVDPGAPVPDTCFTVLPAFDTIGTGTPFQLVTARVAVDSRLYGGASGDPYISVVLRKIRTDTGAVTLVGAGRQPVDNFMVFLETTSIETANPATVVMRRLPRVGGHYQGVLLVDCYVDGSWDVSATH